MVMGQKLNEYEVDHQVSDQVVRLLQKVAGTLPGDRMIAYERMIEILRHEVSQEELKFDEQQEREEQELNGSCSECHDGDLLSPGQTCPSCKLALNDEGMVIS